MTPEKQLQRTQARSRIPDFANREDEAAWFATHDIADFQDEFRTIEVRFARNLSTGINVRLDPDTLAELRKTAHQKGIGPTTLARMWIMEHLKERSGAGSH